MNATRTSLASQFDAIRTQIDQLAADSGYNGVNLLNGDDLTVTFNETGTSTSRSRGVTFNAAGLGITASANDFQTDIDVNARSTDLTSALEHAAFAGGGVRFEPLGRADPPGLHQGDGQHAADRRRQPGARRYQPRRREHAGPADPPVAVHHGPLARRPGQPGVLRLFG